MRWKEHNLLLAEWVLCWADDGGIITMAKKKDDGIGDLVRGALTGIAAALVMERVAALVDDLAGSAASSRARVNGEVDRPALGDQPEWLLSMDRFIAGPKGPPMIRWEVGAGAGLLYGMLRGRVPGVDGASGLAYGAGLYFAADRSEKRSARGALPWLAYGATAELTMRVLEKVSKPDRSTG